MKRKRYLAAAAAAMLFCTAAALAARRSDLPAPVPAAEALAAVATLRHDPQFILEVVAGHMGVTLRPDVPPPGIRPESSTPLELLQAAAERQWGFRPDVFTTTFANATNEIYLIDDARYYARHGGTPDDSLAHELVHYVQARYLRDRFSTDWSESEAVAIQTWFRNEYMAPRLAAAGVPYTGEER